MGTTSFVTSRDMFARARAPDARMSTRGVTAVTRLASRSARRASRAGDGGVGATRSLTFLCERAPVVDLASQRDAFESRAYDGVVYPDLPSSSSDAEDGEAASMRAWAPAAVRTVAGAACEDVSAIRRRALRAVEASMRRVVELVFGGDSTGSADPTTRQRLPRCLLDASLYAGRSMPPCLLQYGGIEVLASEANALAEVASAAGWDDVTLEAFPEMPHVFQVFDSVAPEGAAAISSVGRFMKENAARP